MALSAGAHKIGDYARQLRVVHLLCLEHHPFGAHGGKKILTLGRGPAHAYHQYGVRRRAGCIAVQAVELIGAHGLGFLEYHYLSLGHHRHAHAQVHDGSRLYLRGIQRVLVEFFFIGRYYFLEVFQQLVDIISLLAVQQIHGCVLAIGELSP